MPEDVKEMLGISLQEKSVTNTPRGRPKRKSKHEKMSPVLKTKKEKVQIRQHTVKEKIDQQAKRKVIDEFLNTPKKRLVSTETCPIPFRQQSAKEQKISVLKMLSTTSAPANTMPERPPNKQELSDVIIAAAAAKMVKLDPEGFVLTLHMFLLLLILFLVPPPTMDEVGAQHCKKMLGYCQRGQWDTAGEALKVKLRFSRYYNNLCCADIGGDG